MTIMKKLLLIIALLSLVPQFAFGQATQIEGSKSPGKMSVNSDGSIDVHITSGGGSGGTASDFGAAFPNTGTAAGFKDSGGTLMQPGNLDSSGNVKVNCASGCSGAADTVGTLGALNAGNATASVVLAGDQGAGVLIAAGTLAATVVPELSFDGGTTWVATLFYDPATNTIGASLVFTNPNSATTRTIVLSGGASHARVRVSSYTSGTANATLRATGNQGSVPVLLIPNGTQQVSAASLPLPTDAATQTTLALIKTAIDAIKTDVDKIPASPATEGTLALIKAKTDNLDAAISTLLTLADFDSKTGSLTETAPATDTASSGLNGRLQRIAQRLTSLIALLPAALGAGGGLKVDGSGTALPTSLASIPDSSGQGATGDAAATVGSTGSLSAKLRLITSQLDAITTSVQLIDNMVSGSGINVSQINGVAPLMGSGNTGTGSPRMTIATDQPTLTNTIGNVGEVPITSGGTSLSRTVSAASTNATNVKASAGQVYGIQASNVNAAARYLHLYNTAGTPTCNASIIGTWIIPGNTAGAGTNIPLHPGAAFGTGIGFCITTAVDGTGSVAANDLVLMVEYK